VKLLLDTCTFLWMATDSPRLSPTARSAFADPGNDVYLSVVSAWEIAVKNGLGRLQLPNAVEQFIPKRRDVYGVQSLSLLEDAALHVAKLPELHKDPFDRMLVAQAIVEGLTILTPDVAIAQYPARVLW